MKLPVTIRFAQEGDAPFLTKWLSQPYAMQWFPMCNEREVEDAVRVWISYSKLRAGITACYNGEPVGMSNVYVSPYKKLASQALFSLIVAEPCRGQGVGFAILTELMRLAKEEHHIELLHLEVYDQNPAIFLYQKMGFKEYARHPRFLKLDGVYTDKILMQRKL